MPNEARDIPIIFSAPMVRALLDGRKTQTRRLESSPLRKAKPGDRLWVRECWSNQDCCEGEAMYRATAQRDGLLPDEVAETRWRPSIHMPRWASRITLAVDDVRIERLQDISEKDAESEGVVMTGRVGWEEASDYGGTYRYLFAHLWDSLHAKPGERWEDNPLVVALTFSVHLRNIDEME